MKLFLALVLLLVCFSKQTQAQPDSKQNEYIVKAGDLKEWVSYLASDEMNGRASGSVEMLKAAEWIASRFSEYGLKPLCDTNSFFQEYSIETRNGVIIDERNVIGILEGSDADKKDEYILISAHFDHVGIGRPIDGDSIYNGADDNAAGTCTLIGIARTINELNLEPGRSIIFAAVSGEEIGLRGSRYLVKNPPFKLENTFVNINFEMTGHSALLGRNNYYMTGCDYSNLDDVINEFNQQGSHKLIDTIAMANRLFYMSDNVAFAMINRVDDIQYGIPCGTFATTTFGDHIHKPYDEAELFDFENMAGLVDHFTELIVFLSKTEKRIDWTDKKFQRLK